MSQIKKNLIEFFNWIKSRGQSGGTKRQQIPLRKKYNQFIQKKQKVEQKYLKGFILDYEDQQLLYYSDLDSLKLLKFHLSKHLFQSKVQDEYEARTVIGEGNYAMVLELKHLHSDQIFAAKCIEKKKLQKVDNGMKSVLNEIRIMRTLSPHSLIVNLHEVYEGDNNIYIVLDLMKGGSLYSEMKMKNRLFTRHEIQTIMKNILTGLAYMHSKGIMHRDLKPENILFQNKGDLNSLKLADFGLAAFANEYPYLYPKCGTPGFVAPEIANLVNKLDNYDVKCDIFSAGIIFHILLVGESPFSGRGHLELLRQNKLCDFNERASIYNTLSLDSRSLLFKMLDLDPKVRPQAAQCLDHAYFLADHYPDIGQHYIVPQQWLKQSVEPSETHQDKMRQCSLIISSPMRPVNQKPDLVNYPMFDFEQSNNEFKDQMITPELLQAVDSGKVPSKTNDFQEKE